MNIRNTIIKHYKKFFDLHAKGIALTEDDHLDIDWAESNGFIYVDEGKIVSECESDDLDVTHWRALPEPPCC